MIVRFYAVGLLGVVVQLVVLSALTRVFHVNYLISTAVAVEIAIVHNFFWHDRWTWRERTSKRDSARTRLHRLWKFNASAGAICLVANVLLTGALAGIAGVPYVVANLLAIAAASVATYVIGDAFVFRLRIPTGSG